MSGEGSGAGSSERRWGDGWEQQIRSVVGCGAGGPSRGACGCFLQPQGLLGRVVNTTGLPYFNKCLGNASSGPSLFLSWRIG